MSGSLGNIGNVIGGIGKALPELGGMASGIAGMFGEKGKKIGQGISNVTDGLGSALGAGSSAYGAFKSGDLKGGLGAIGQGLTSMSQHAGAAAGAFGGEKGAKIGNYISGVGGFANDFTSTIGNMAEGYNNKDYINATQHGVDSIVNISKGIMNLFGRGRDTGIGDPGPLSKQSPHDKGFDFHKYHPQFRNPGIGDQVFRNPVRNPFLRK